MASRRAVLLLGVLLAAGCGYRLLGAGGASAARIWVGPVSDDSTEPLFGAHVRTALAREVVDRAEVSLADRSGATALLTCRVVSVKETSKAFVAGDKPRQYILEAEGEATLTGRDNKVIWKGLKIQADRLFTAGASVGVTEANKAQAIELLAGDLAREIARRVSLVLGTLPPG